MKDPKYYKNGVECTESDEPTHILQEDGVYMILQEQTGREYPFAYDVYPCPYTYTATTNLIPTPQLSAEEQLNYLGVDEI